MKKKIIFKYLLLVVFSFFIFLAGTENVYADECTDKPSERIKLQVPLGPISNVPNLGSYLQQVYQLSLSIVGIVAIAMIMIGGVKWITAAGNQSKVQQAKDYIFSAVVGIALLLGAFAVLQLINPQLTNLGINIPCQDNRQAVVPTTVAERRPRELTTEESIGKAAVVGLTGPSYLLLSQTETGREYLKKAEDAATTGVMVAEELPGAIAEVAQERVEQVGGALQTAGRWWGRTASEGLDFFRRLGD